MSVVSANSMPEDQLFEQLADTAVAPGGDADSQTSTLEHTLRGEVLRVVFASDDGNYVVLRLLTTDGVEHTLVGPLGGMLEGQEIVASGRWETHKDHGRQFRVTEFRSVLPSSEEGIRRYLASGLIPGIGPKYAERIVAAFGKDTLEVLDNYSERLKQVPGIGKKRIAEIRKAWKEHAAQREIMVFLQGLGLGAAYCARIIARYGAGAAEVVRRNPYQLAEDVHGVGFLTADRIAGKLGVEKEDPLRLAAGVVYVLGRLAERGHSCYERPGLVTEAGRILEVGEDAVEVGLTRALQNGTAVLETEQCEPKRVFVYPRRLYAAEVELAASLTHLLAVPGSRVVLPENAFGRGYGELNEQQQRAVQAAFAESVSIITGGPGVGKTTIVGQIVEAARRTGRYALLAAPTGRAAKRLSESTGIEAKTVHRLLKWDPASRSFVHNRDKPLRCDLLVVDEVSMLDVVLANDLFRAVRAGTQVVLVGDRDQLPSVGPGFVLHDLIACGRITVTHLAEIYRQEADSRIVLNAHAVNRGEMPDLRPPAPSSGLVDFYWIDQDDPERVLEVIARLVAERIPSRFRLNPLTDVQVLAPMHRGSCGALALNEMMQQRLNPGPKPEFKFGDRTFRSGDRVMQVVNNYDKGVFNGELGQIVQIDRKSKTFKVSFDIGIVDYGCQEADQIRHAYAVTVHKSQGSEFPAVVVPLLTQHYMMLQRNLVYTAMTRARRLLVLIGTRKALAIAIRNNRPMLRCSRLAERLQATDTDAGR